MERHTVGRLTIRRLHSATELRDAAPAWDRLWQQSEVPLPTARAELVALWVEHFAPRAALQVLMVEQDGEPVAALPMVGRPGRGFLPVGDLTWNYWSPNGELLLDRAAEAEPVLEALASALRSLPWPLSWLDLAPVATPRWRGFVEALGRQGFAVDQHPRYHIGLIAVDSPFEEYFAARSRNHRHQVRKNLKRLETVGAVQCSVHTAFTPDEVHRQLQQALQIESRSWKHRAGRTVLETPGMLEFYRRQARQLAEWGLLRLAFLEAGGERIAFELGWTGKGVYHCFKIGYLPSHAEYSPGHVLRYLHLQQLFSEGRHTLIDFQGPLTDAVARWATGSYPIGRLVIAPPTLRGRLLLAGYRGAAALMRRVRAAAGRGPADHGDAG